MVGLVYYFTGGCLRNVLPALAGSYIALAMACRSAHLNSDVRPDWPTSGKPGNLIDRPDTIRYT
jgi:hypothetical protein